MQQQPTVASPHDAGLVRIAIPVMGAFLILLPLLFMFNIGASAADGKHLAPAASAAPFEHAPDAGVLANAPDNAPNDAVEDCATKSIVPAAECLALVELYTQTNGTGWISRTHWLQFGSNAPCGWFGVVCANDGNGPHVRRLILPGNQLSGTLPLSLGNLTELRRLRLENNALRGRIPPTLCALGDLEVLNLGYNALFTLRRSVYDCVAALDDDWAASQTVPVRNLRLAQILTDTLMLSWTPISYTEDGGYYEVAISPNPTGPFTTHGTTTDKLASSYAVTGLMPGTSYFVRVRTYTPAHGDQPSDVYSLAAYVAGVTQAESGRVLVATYFPADNDLSPEIPYVIERIRRGTVTNPNVQVVMLVDGRKHGDTRILTIDHGNVVYTDAVVIDEWGTNELDTADPAVLAWFLQYARHTYPSEREVVTIIGHGVALAPEVAWPQSAATLATTGSTHSGAIPPLPKEHDYSPSDVTNRGYMSAVDMGEALMIATNNGAEPFDLIFFDQCFQGNLDTLYEVRNSAHIYIASPNYAWLVAAYDRYLVRFTPTATPEEMGLAIVNQYENSLNNRHPNAIFGITNADLLAIAAQVSTLADALLAAIQANEHSKIAGAAQQSQYVDTTQCGERNLRLGPPDELIGLESFAQALLVEFGLGDPYGIETALAGLYPLMLNVVKRSITGSPYLAPAETWDYVNSLTVLAPLPRNSPSDVAWRASIYREKVPFSATWTISPTEPISVTASLAFVRDGRWDEFLAAWYVGLEPTVGQWCHYVPPPQVTVSETESLSLTAGNITTNSVQLAWTPTDNTAATEYWLYAREPYAVGWQVGQSIALTETALLLAPLDAGEYSYMVVARNFDLETIAQSNAVTVTITGDSPQDPDDPDDPNDPDDPDDPDNPDDPDDPDDPDNPDDPDDPNDPDDPDDPDDPEDPNNPEEPLVSLLLPFVRRD